MKLFLLAVLTAAASLAQADVRDDATALNVNSRYTVESVDLPPDSGSRLSGAITEEIHKLVGERFNPDSVNRLSQRITEELRARSVTFRVVRGASPAHVRITFEVERRDSDFDVSLSGLTYNSREGWTGTGQATWTLGDNVVTAAGLSNGDDQVERYSGLRTRFDRMRVGTNRIRLGVEFDMFREQYDGRTSSLGAGAYRSRTNVEPSATFVLAKPLTLSLGMSFENLQPNAAALATSANAVVSSLRYHERWEGADSNSRDVDGAYRLRAATIGLGSNVPYTKHTANVRYQWRKLHQLAEVTLMAGMIHGEAPLFERFVLGTNTTLRGWSKYDLNPLGGNRMRYASVTYGYHIMRVFYDTGSVWDHGKSAEERHSAGVGVTTGMGLFSKNALLVALAFPIRRGHVEPMVVAGMNF